MEEVGDEVLVHILTFVPPGQLIGKVSRVCRRWWAISHEPALVLRARAVFPTVTTTQGGTLFPSLTRQAYVCRAARCGAPHTGRVARP